MMFLILLLWIIVLDLMFSIVIGMFFGRVFRKVVRFFLLVGRNRVFVVLLM